MSLNDIKKILYKENPRAIFMRIQKGHASYRTIAGGEFIFFQVPIADMGDAAFEREMDSKLLIRYIVKETITF